MNYSFHATETSWDNFYKLPPSQKALARRAWGIFKTDPFHPRLGAHQIHKLSALLRRAV